MENRYSRNIPSITEEEQELLKKKKVAILGCAGMAGYAEDVKAALGMEVIDPSSVALKVTEALVACGIKPSKRGLYAYPPSFIRAGKAKNPGCNG